VTTPDDIYLPKDDRIVSAFIRKVFKISPVFVLFCNSAGHLNKPLSKEAKRDKNIQDEIKF